MDRTNRIISYLIKRRRTPAFGVLLEGTMKLTAVSCVPGSLLGHRRDSKRRMAVFVAILVVMFLPGIGFAQGPSCEEQGLCTLGDGSCGIEVDGVCRTIEDASCLQAGGCLRPDGSCGIEVDGVCRTIEDASCLQAGGCLRPDGSCGVEVDGVCRTMEEASCLQAGGCLRPDGSCGIEVDGVCRTMEEASCLQNGKVWENGECIDIVAEPATIVLVGSGLLGLSLARKWFRQRTQRPDE